MSDALAAMTNHLVSSVAPWPLGGDEGEEGQGGQNLQQQQQLQAEASDLEAGGPSHAAHLPALTPKLSKAVHTALAILLPGAGKGQPPSLATAEAAGAHSTAEEEEAGPGCMGKGEGRRSQEVGLQCLQSTMGFQPDPLSRLLAALSAGELGMALSAPMFRFRSPAAHVQPSPVV